MESADRLERGLWEIIAAVCAGQQSSSQTNHLIHICHALASAFVLSKISRNALSPERFGLDYSDIAFDSIAELFARNTSGSFPELQSYFNATRPASDAESLSMLRRLVFSKVNNRIFRMYNEIDPGLGKIIRNVKNAARGLFEEYERFGDACISPAGMDPMLHLPILERDELYTALRQRTSGNGDTPKIISALHTLLSEETEHSRAIPIVIVATVVRMLYDEPAAKEVSENDAELNLAKEDMIGIIDDACAQIKAESRTTYVTNRGMSQLTYDAYFVVIRKRLMRLLVEQDGSGASLSQLFLETLPGLTHEEYARIHRHRIEYLASRVLSEALKRARNG